MNSPLSYISRFFTEAGNFTGRTSRAEYWYTCLWLTLIIQLPATIITLALGFLNKNETVLGIIGVYYCYYSGIFAVPSIAMFARRMHDSDRSAWHLLWYFTLIGCFPILYWIGFKPGSTGPNRFGADPLTNNLSIQVTEPVVDQRVTRPSDAQTGQIPQPQQGAGNANLLDRLEQISRLRQQGILTDEEFAEQKRIILGA